jgi:hypothetical protein
MLSAAVPSAKPEANLNPLSWDFLEGHCFSFFWIENLISSVGVACIVGESGGNPDDDLHPGSAITNMYASRGLAGDNVSMRYKTQKSKGADHPLGLADDYVTAN